MVGLSVGCGQCKVRSQPTDNIPGMNCLNDMLPFAPQHPPDLVREAIHSSALRVRNTEQKWVNDLLKQICDKIQMFPRKSSPLLSLILTVLALAL